MKVYTVAEAAILLNVNEETIRRWTRTGKLSADRRVGRGGTRITSNAIESMLQTEGFEKFYTNYIREQLIASRDIDDDLINDSVPETKEEEGENDCIQISKEDLKYKISELIIMRDALNKQIEDLIRLL